MPMWDVEVIQPGYYEKMTKTEQRKYKALYDQWHLAASRCETWEWKARSAATSKEFTRFANRADIWSDRSSKKRIALSEFCKEIDAKYAPVMETP